LERRRLGREDLVESSPYFRDGEIGSGVFHWRVYKSYEVKTYKDTTHNVDGLEYDVPYFVASDREGRGASRIAKIYDPFIDTPYLFLEFARMRRQGDAETDALHWISMYGLLGITRRKRRPLAPGVFTVEDFTGIVIPPWRYDDRGGKDESVDYFWNAAAGASRNLVLYEAVLNQNYEELEWYLFDEGSHYIDTVRERELRRACREQERTGATWDEILIDHALKNIGSTVASMLQTFAYPLLFRRRENRESLGGANTLEVGYGVRNLLGVMYLQFYWLITSQGDLYRCKNCGRIISHATPISTSGQSRKPRKDKIFCDYRCRQRHHYQNRVKPARKKGNN
jgi:hypothetical protein